MRFVLALIFILATAPAFAACEVESDPDWGRETAEQARQALCLQLELSRRSMEEQRLAQLEAEHRLRLQMLELQLRMEQQLATLSSPQLAAIPPIVPAF